ncbi:ABC transporter permease [Streptomyces sp. NPDC088354]|uniref:ABC transporter permease n=1 Tax=unclassified Streptomyces TaxID=2593676 RepID=UPI0029ABC822|nr:ABC transporter permease [Streptomyces sp. MI02-7b]MDX3076857.1 ABC transporter permease [Streptomyces sp. MI02-7b]
MGARFAVTGGREGWARTLLTAVGVGLGVTLLLLTTAIPTVLSHRHDRERARNDMTSRSVVHDRADDTMLIAVTDTAFRGADVRGRLVQPEGPHAPVPPGLTELPDQGAMAVSPALRRLLRSSGGALLRDRLPYRDTGTIGEDGLIGPGELAYYAGTSGLRPGTEAGRVERIHAFGSRDPGGGPDPVLVLLVLIVFVVLLMPVGVFIAAAVRFGGERRDRRLAALRLVGADAHTARLVAAGEALAGAVGGLAFGGALFALGRALVARFTVFGVDVFPGDVDPVPALAALVLVAVPVAAVAVTLLALRGVVVEPLGVVRTARPPRRRLWWRLLVPLGGLGLLSPMMGQGRDSGNFNQAMVISGTVLLLVGVTALLPWIVEAVVGRLGAGWPSWQLAVRRLQLSSGTAARTVNGIAVAVAGAVALQMLFAGVEADYTRHTGQDLKRAQMVVALPAADPVDDAARRLGNTRGVRSATGLADGVLGERPTAPDRYVELTVGNCDALREVAELPSCRDGDAFVIGNREYDQDTAELAHPGRLVYVDPGYEQGAAGLRVPWRLPRALRTAGLRSDPSGYERGGVLVTPGAFPATATAALTGKVYVSLDPAVPDARELLRNTAARIDPLASPVAFAATEQSRRFSAIRTGLFVGATCVLLLIGASLLVSQLEQLRERRRLLSMLVAFGTRRRTLSLSVLWQTALPVALGLVLACAVGIGLGAVLLRMVNAAVGVDWPGVAAMAGIAAGVVLLVTSLSLPPLVRMMRPDGLRTE